MLHKPLPPFASWAGPRDARLVIVGEAWGRHEFDLKKPFVGESGKLLFEMLGEAFPTVVPDLHAEISSLFRYGLAWVGKRNEWLHAASIAFTNTLALRPHANNILELCCKKPDLPHDYDYSPIEKAQYLRPEYLPELDRLRSELEECRPNLILAAGAKAAWGLLGDTKISSIRGGITESTLVPGTKLLPTYHPAAVLRQWSWRPIVVADLMKSAREMKFAQIERPSRQVIFDPTLEQVVKWCGETLANPERWPEIGADTETSKGQITMLSLARQPDDVIVIPFIDEAKPGFSYWLTANEEIAAWSAIASLLESRRHSIVWQNGLYDLQYILPLGIAARSDEDTMLLHHSILPELQKGLGFLGSVYTSEPSWKLMRTRKADTVKRDE